MTNQQLTKKERLRKSKSIENLFNKGLSFNNFPFKIIYAFSTTDINKNPRSRVVFIVPKRQFKKAVCRNNLKRKMKEAFRKNKESLYTGLSEKHQSLVLAVLYISNENLDYQFIESKMKDLLQELVFRINKEK